MKSLLLFLFIFSGALSYATGSAAEPNADFPSLEGFPLKANYEICGWQFTAQTGLPDYDRVYYKWRLLKDQYRVLNEQFAKRKIDANTCWTSVGQLLKRSGIPGGFPFKPRGAPDEFKVWYDQNYNRQMNSNFPGSEQSYFDQELIYLSEIPAEESGS